MKEELNGIDIVEEAGMKERHVLVTNMYLGDIKGFNEKAKFLKMFNKVNMPDILVEIKQ